MHINCYTRHRWLFEHRFILLQSVHLPTVTGLFYLVNYLCYSFLSILCAKNRKIFKYCRNFLPWKLIAGRPAVTVKSEILIAVSSRQPNQSPGGNVNFLFSKNRWLLIGKFWGDGKHVDKHEVPLINMKACALHSLATAVFDGICIFVLFLYDIQ